MWLRRVFLRGRTVALPSQNLMRIATDTWRLDPSWLRYVPNGIDLARFAGPPLPPPWRGEGPIIGTVTALRAEKNLASPASARSGSHSASHPARLVIIGDGPERPELELSPPSSASPSRVHFAGHVAEPAPLIRALDMFALSSDTEQMPISLLEAMAAGLPAVSTDVGDVRAMLSADDRSFVTALDDGAMAAALQA